MRELPRGTVTFLFTDVEGSTRLLTELGDAYAAALQAHRDAIRNAVLRHAGVEVDTQGDAFFVVFARAADALAAAAEAQAALAAGPIRVRMGVHTGEPQVTDEGYVGLDVHRAARIASAGHGGQVLVSQSARDLLGGTPLRDLGEHRLKDLGAPERIFQLGDVRFPPLKSLDATNLPVAASSLIGREREVAALLELVRTGRVTTVVGPGGAGKTRLALQVAAELVGEYAGGVFFVPLAGVPHAELVDGAIASTLGIRDLEELRERPALLLVDNLEHLLDAAPSLAQLTATPSGPSLLATSRAPLHIAGERVYTVDPLPIEDAVLLLADRARAFRPDFTLDADAEEICRRLDGLPLALELAAARLRTLGSRTLLERLDERLPVLTGGRRDAPERQRTLRATLEWSYGLLRPEEQRAFARLGVFSTFSLAAAEVVAEADLDLVDALVDASLLKPIGGDRFLMLETVRELALERLENAGELHERRRRLAEHLLELAKSANLNIECEGPMRHDLVIPERDNIRAVLTWSLEAGELELGLRLALRLENFWSSSVDAGEGMRWVEELLAKAQPTPEERALALRCLGNCASMAGERAKAVGLYEESLDAFRALGDELRTAVGLHRLAANLDLHTAAERTRALNDEALEIFRKLRFAKGEAQSLSVLAALERAAGNVDGSLELLDRSLALCRESGFTWWERNVLLFKAEVLLEAARPEQAALAAAANIEIAQRLADRVGIVDGLIVLARVALLCGDEATAGLLVGALEAEHERSPVPAWQVERRDLDEAIRDHGGEAFAASCENGRHVNLVDAVSASLAWVERAEALPLRSPG